jgi:predicted dehydrogenase
MLPYMRARHHRWWRGHRAYGGGVLMDWIGHHNDIAHWALDIDRDGPTRIEATEWVMPRTGVYNAPEHYTIQCSYAGGIESTISSRNEGGLKLIGDEGWVFVNRGVLKASDERWLAPEFDPGEIKVYRSDDHTGNFLECVKSRQQCIAPAETGHRSITPGHLGFFSAERDQVIEWDAKAEVVKGDDELNKLLQTVHYRAPLNIA